MKQETLNTFTIVNELGLHARAASKLVQLAEKFQSEIKFLKGESEVDAKSILGLLTLACMKGTQVQVKATGRDAESAIEQIGRLISDKFGEGR
jgi:phosphocarrier protein